jgi:hypothetical protein
MSLVKDMRREALRLVESQDIITAEVVVAATPHLLAALTSLAHATLVALRTINRRMPVYSAKETAAISAAYKEAKEELLALTRA